MEETRKASARPRPLGPDHGIFPPLVTAGLGQPCGLIISAATALWLPLPYQALFVSAGVLEKLAGNYVSLSMNKYGSNVVETCIKSSIEDQVAQIISEMIIDPNFLGVLQVPFRNMWLNPHWRKKRYIIHVLSHTLSNAPFDHFVSIFYSSQPIALENPKFLENQ
ncbi:hypothetical protein Vadar_001424 [Vaccinium darrowii]|uniref:Uncharacterized protein n=1 Tax=Vaccinium darrowii TaxID=229202 RepID=A0ACB7YT85_9ERIC|nr:hypothetical protein Vadar_001424 [Vaccinium darrowii]